MSRQPGPTCATSSQHCNTCTLVVLCIWTWSLQMFLWLTPAALSWGTSGSCLSSNRRVQSLERGKWKTTSRREIPGTWPPSCSVGSMDLLQMFSGTTNMNKKMKWSLKRHVPDWSVFKLVPKNILSFSLGVSILELACNMEVPNGGEGWQQLRQGCLPSEFTSGEIHFLRSPHEVFHYLPSIFEMTSTISLCIRRPFNWASDSIADDAGARTIWEAKGLWASRSPRYKETPVEEAHLSFGHRDHVDTVVLLSGRRLLDLQIISQGWALNYEHFGISCMPIGYKLTALW